MVCPTTALIFLLKEITSLAKHPWYILISSLAYIFLFLNCLITVPLYTVYTITINVIRT